MQGAQTLDDLRGHRLILLGGRALAVVRLRGEQREPDEQPVVPVGITDRGGQAGRRGDTQDGEGGVFDRGQAGLGVLVGEVRAVVEFHEQVLHAGHVVLLVDAPEQTRDFVLEQAALGGEGLRPGQAVLLGDGQPVEVAGRLPGQRLLETFRRSRGGHEHVRDGLSGDLLGELEGG